MARDFDGVNDEVDFGSAAGIDNYTTYSISMWIVSDKGNNTFENYATKGDGSNGWRLGRQAFVDPDVFQFVVEWTTTNGIWRAGTFANAILHVVVTYDNTLTTNDPIIYQDGVSQTVTTTATPVGSIDLDAIGTLVLGHNGAGGADADGRVSHLVYDDSIWTTAQVNRARWWGTPGGAVRVYHPLVTTKVANEGTEAADGTVSGSTMASLPRVERMWGSMMGCGR